MTEALKLCNKLIKKSELRKASATANSQPSSRKQTRKRENPMRVLLASEQPSDNGLSNAWTCKNSACRAALSINDTFCKRCSCCICHLFDDKRIPVFGWYAPLRLLDGSYCCATCGKVSGILGLLDKTSRFKELHEFVKDAKAKLEAEVGTVNGVSAKMERGIVSRLSVAGDIHKLCSLAIEKADEWLTTLNTNPKCQDSRPSACRFLFEEITSSSVAIILIEMSTAHLMRLRAISSAGDLGHSEAKCFTKSVQIIHKNPNSTIVMNHKKDNALTEGSSSGSKELTTNGSSVFKVRDLGKIMRLACAEEQGYLEGFCSTDIDKCRGAREIVKPETREHDHVPSVSRELDLNVASVPDLNEELTPPFESSRDEDNGCTLGQAVEADDDAASHEIETNGLARSNGSGDSQTWTNGPTGEVPAVDSHTELCRKRVANSNEEAHDCDSTLINSSPFRISKFSTSLDENFESCVKIIRWLECEGHINQEFRLKLLTWFSLRSTEQERRVVNTFIQTLIDDPVAWQASWLTRFQISYLARGHAMDSVVSCGTKLLLGILNYRIPKIMRQKDLAHRLLAGFPTFDIQA
ncbi:hypothetical protein F3Y22_tig00112487pilonHSYRG00085 [Hibiscus syriacus]|uniref:VIN3-like C-terminal domain-containing protein n=1 Tax=Hibiscus syriacus TaxID=106335 RepID=A0A6A2XID6_HIBSY|nr:hypothetical protein F3Y22_tig00112487pilonHSYRG00085 [Hibiscus syriacus]